MDESPFGASHPAHIGKRWPGRTLGVKSLLRSARPLKRLIGKCLRGTIQTFGGARGECVSSYRGALKTWRNRKARSDADSFGARLYWGGGASQRRA
jgi:hypothetical protein